MEEIQSCNLRVGARRGTGGARRVGTGPGDGVAVVRLALVVSTVLGIALGILFTILFPSTGRGAADVGIYMLAVACTEDLLSCTRLRIERFETFEDCRARVLYIATHPDRYGVAGRPVVMGWCRSWAPPFSWGEQ